MRSTAAPLLFALSCLGACPRASDEDGDGWDATLDCDDADPEQHPEAPELCDGADQDCDPDTFAEGELDDLDADGFSACEDCDDADATTFPGAAPVCDGEDRDCDGELDDGDAPGDSPACPAGHCAEQPDGDRWLSSALDPFVVSCEGGWLRIAWDAGDGVVVASRAADNPWHKCDDDAGAPFGLPDREEVIAPDFEGAGQRRFDPVWQHPESGQPYDSVQLAALRAAVSELHPQQRLVALTADDDFSSWQDGDGSGLEVFAVLSDGDWWPLTPGTGHDCGAGPGSWPAPASQSALYRWSTDVALSEASGFTGDPAEDLPALPAEAVLPVSLHLGVFTGGGVAVGWSERVLRVR